MSERSSEVTELLVRARDDTGTALRELLPLVREELHRIAGAQMRNERGDHTLQPTALVHEAFVRLAQSPTLPWKDRAQFLAVAAQAMRHVLVDHARARGARKRGGDRQRVTLTGGVSDLGLPSEANLDLLDLNDKLEELRASHERPAQVVEMRFFGGLSFEEAGHVLGLSPRTVQADWHFARAWLARALKSPRSDDPE